MKAVCYQLLQIFEPHCNISNAAQLGDHHALRDSAISETYPQVMEHITPWQSTLLTLARMSYRLTARASAGRLLSTAASTWAAKQCIKRSWGAPCPSRYYHLRDISSGDGPRYVPSFEFIKVSAHRLLLPSLTSASSGSLIISCCTNMACYTTDLTLLSLESTKSFEIPRSLRDIR